MNRSRSVRLLAVFPSLEEIGGVQASAGAAWRGIAEASKGDDPVFEPLALTYGASPSIIDLRRKHARTKPGAAVKALGLRDRFDVALFWHVSLLKLKPFLLRHPLRSVLFLHGIEVWRPFDLLGRNLASSLDLILCNSAHTWRRFVEMNPWAETLPHEVTPLGLHLPYPDPTPEPAEPPSAVMISRLDLREGYKGHREVIAAWPAVLERIPSARLLVVGDGTGRPPLDALVRSLGLRKSVSFLGICSEEAKLDTLRQSRALLLPSRAEGFGLVYLEAMRLGRPCLVSDVDAGREVVAPPEAGLAADPTDTPALADAIVRLLTPSPEWDAWSVRARARYEEQFTERAFQKRFIDSLSTLAPRPSSGSAT